MMGDKPKIPLEALIRGGKSQTPDQRTFSRDRKKASEAGKKGKAIAIANRKRREGKNDAE